MKVEKSPTHSQEGGYGWKISLGLGRGDVFVDCKLCCVDDEVLAVGYAHSEVIWEGMAAKRWR